MTILIGGIAAVTLGAVGAAIWWCPLLEFLAALIPLVLIAGGAIAIYFGVDELRYPLPQEPPSYETKEAKPASPETPPAQPQPEGEASGKKEEAE
jgi:hypothetical protein